MQKALAAGNGQGFGLPQKPCLLCRLREGGQWPIETVSLCAGAERRDARFAAG